MTRFRFIFNSLLFYKKQHLGIFLAIIVSAAVLTGALIIGDSVRGSLQNLVDIRLGKVENVLVTGDRFVTNELAETISTKSGIKTASILLAEAISVVPENQNRVNKVQLLGIDSSFWSVSDISLPGLFNNQVIVSSNLAHKLDIDKGDEFLIRVRNAEIIPVNAPFSIDDEQSIAIRVKLEGIADDSSLGRFNLKNDQKSPYNIFINRGYLSDKLGLAGFSNVIITEGREDISTEELNQILKDGFRTDDAGLIITSTDKSEYIDITSQRIFIDNTVPEKLEHINVPHHNILTYFVNDIASNNLNTPYSFISSVPDGYFETIIDDNGIIVNSWLADDLHIKVGDSVFLKYFTIGPLRKLIEKEHRFIVQDIIPITGKENNNTLMPEFPGLSDAESCGDWDAGIPIDLTKIRDKDEEYWEEYKGTPKAFISLNSGLNLWKNDFGDYTTIRFKAKDLHKNTIISFLESNLDPKDFGISFINARDIGTRAASNGVDFGELFLSLSFFIILSALILTILMTSLNLQSRMTEIGILSSMGISKKQIVRLRIYEYSLVIIVGSIVGGICGILYNNLIISALNNNWNDAIHADSISLIVIPKTIISGIVISMVISFVSIYITTVRLLKKSGISLIQKQYSARKKGSKTLASLLGITLVLISLGYAIYTFVISTSLNSSSVLIAGLLFLLGSIIVLSQIFARRSSNRSSGLISPMHLAIKNISRNTGRSITVVALLAIGTFTIIVTGSNRLTFSGSELESKSGTGGTQYWVENTIPINKDLNTADARAYYGLDEDFMDEVSFIQLQNIEGDDASCLNLNQVQNPQLLGIDPQLFDSLQAFSFATNLFDSNSPWLDLNKDLGKNIIPAIADQTVIQWGLMKSIGDTIPYLNEYGDSIYIVLVGGLSPSIFQGNVLISNKNLVNNYPSVAGSKIMLVHSSVEHSNKIPRLLSKYFSDYGIEVSPASQRLREFYSVTNTYLTIFMILGGLGVILGTLGLGIVIIRNLQERKYELHTYLALGFTVWMVKKIILLENIVLLVSGILIGVVSAIIGIIPSLLSQSYHIPGNFIYLLILIITINGLIWIFIPTTLIINKKDKINLRNE